MTDFLLHLSRHLHVTSGELWLVAGTFAGSFVASLAIVTVFVVRMPADYFSAKKPHAAWTWSAWAVGRNVLGVLLILGGIVLALPGVPGQGLLTILVGLMLTNLPGVRGLERALVRRPGIRHALDRLRRRFGKPPLVVE